MKRSGVFVTVVVLAIPGVGHAQVSPWSPPAPPRPSVDEGRVYPTGEQCEPSHPPLEPFAEYLATGPEIEVIPFEDTVFPKYNLFGLRIMVDLSAAEIRLPRGVWWISIQPMTDVSLRDWFYQVLDANMESGFGPYMYSPYPYWYWVYIRDIYPDAGGMGMRIVADRGQLIFDSTYMTEEQSYINAWSNFGEVFGADYRVAEDFVAPHPLTIVKVRADFLTRLGLAPSEGAWVRIYENVFCPQPALEGPFPGRAGEVNELHAANLRYGDAVHFVYGLAPGEFPIPGCGGATIDIANPVYLGHATADVDGNAALSLFVPDHARGRTILFQALQRTTCLRSSVVAHRFE